MERSIFSYLYRHSKRQQLVTLVMTVFSFPFLYYSLDLPKRIINDALSGDEGTRSFLGMTFEPVSYLFLLCGIFLILVLINGGFKYVINVYKGIVGERMLRRLRYELYSRILRFPLPHFRRVSQGELVQMINAEVEPLGGFIGDAFAQPAFQGGTLLTILFFMFLQDPLLGLAAIALYPVQVYVIPKLQRQVNELGKRRVRQVRVLAEGISETAAGARDLRANDATEYARSRFSKELGIVFNIRFDIYKKKFFIKFLNNFMAQLGPFLFFSIGGYLVITGDLTIGALVAVIAAQKDLASPWKELLAYYQMFWDVRIKFEQVVSQFDPVGLRDEALQTADPDEHVQWSGDLRAANLMLSIDDQPILEGASFQSQLPSHIAIIGPAGSGKEELTLVLAGLLEPDAGRVLINNSEVAKLAESIIGRRMAYSSHATQVFGGTIADNLLLGLKHRPLKPREPEGEIDRHYRWVEAEAQMSGSSLFDPDADWVDYEAAGLSGPEDVLNTAIEVLRFVNLDEDVYQLGLRASIDPERTPELAARALDARRAMAGRFESDPQLGRLVEVFDPERYNTNATLAENLLFGTPVGDDFKIDNLAEHPYVIEIIEECGLVDDLRQVGFKLASTMVELFADLPPDHEYFRQFSFINPEDLPDYKTLLSRADPSNLEALPEADRQRLLSLPFKLAPARHRLGLIDDALQSRVLEARRLFREKLPERFTKSIAFFDPDQYNPAATLQDNILFGRIAYGQAQAAQKISELIAQVLDDLGMHGEVVAAGLEAEVGVGGSRLSLPQRQKLALGRAIMKQPEVLIFFEPTGALDPVEQTDLMRRILERFADRTVIWGLQRTDQAPHFGRVLVMREGRIVEQGSYDELNREGTALRTMIAAA